MGRTLIFLLLASLPLFAESPLASPQGAFFALSVPDCDTSAAWYQKHLGFRVVNRSEAPNKIAKAVLLEGNGTLLEIIQHSKAKPFREAAPNSSGPHEVHGLFKVGLHVRDIDAAYKFVKESGAEIAYDLATAREMGLRSFTIRDHDRNLIQFFGK
jgi:catechol 2,3-dioxygenase-like lactoylglutathione lyase family enzyme